MRPEGIVGIIIARRRTGNAFEEMRSSNMKGPRPEKCPDALKVLYFPMEGLLQGREINPGNRRGKTPAADDLPDAVMEGWEGSSM